MRRRLKVPDSRATLTFYDGLMDGQVGRGLWGADRRFDPSKIADSQSTRAHFLDVVRPYLTPRTRVLDLGCGPGGFLTAIAPYCGEIVGVDLSAAFVAKCRRIIAARGFCNAAVVQGTGESLSFGNGTFNVVVMVDTIHHMEKPNLVMAEVARVLNPGGRLLIFEPNKMNPALFAMCALDRNEWGLFRLGTVGSYRRLLGGRFNVETSAFNGLLIGPDAPWSASVIRLLNSSAAGPVLCWLNPKIFVSAVRSGGEATAVKADRPQPPDRPRGGPDDDS